ncbi:MAG: hypothetical protein JST26_05585 [Bacteroidetes bacterium]|nr:hypothetical protein [Bacteroidota bacterium]
MQTTIIEQYLLGIDQGTFQKMMNHLLYLDGYKFIGSPGSVIGKNKSSKGAPDSFFEDGDNFAFCEYTTQERVGKGQTFFDKLKSDIAHCFNKTNTDIEPANVSKVILAFTEELKPAELNELKALVKSFNPNAELIIYSIQQIPFNILRYPGFGDKYVPGVKTTKGTLYTLPDFLTSTTNNIQPSLVNEFVGREDEIKTIKEILSKTDVLIISGSAGVGKSKLAVQMTVLYEAEGFMPMVIASSPVPLWDDLQTFLLPDKKYVVLFDDANKALHNLEYLFHFTQQREPGSIKVMITVRDYVRAELNKIIVDKKFADFDLKILSDEKIKEIIKKLVPAGRSIDPVIIERILSLAKGNSRLALMATRLIIENNNAEVLRDVTSLYDEYFKKIETEIAFLSKPEYLKALGILSFFGVLDKGNEELKKKLSAHFDVNWDRLWEIYLELEQYELVDVFSKEAAKISDQVLATYVFYKAFIDEASSVINYSLWIEHSLGSFDKKINKTLIDVINTFGFNELKDRLTTLIIDVQKKTENDPELSFKFYSIFWFYREIDTLQFIKKWIDGLEQEEIETSKIKFTYGNNEFVWPSDHIGLLQNFWHHNTQFTQLALELGLDLAFKQPSKIPEILKHLNEHIAYHRFDYRIGYARQHMLFNTLLKQGYSEKQQYIVDQIFLEKAGSFLGWDHNQVEGYGDGQMMIYNYALFKMPELMELREKILTKAFSLFTSHEERVLKILNKYIWAGKEFDPAVYADEQILLTEFFKQNFKPNNYSHCRLIHQYVKRLEEYGIKPIHDWFEFIGSELVDIAGVFTWTFDNWEGDFTKREQEKEKRIKDLVKGKDLAFIVKVLKQVQDIYNKDEEHGESHSITMSLGHMFRSIAEQDKKLFFSALELLMQGRYEFDPYLNIIYYPVKLKLVEPKEFYNQINRYEYKMKPFWKLSFFEALEKDEIDEFLLKEFVGLIYSPNCNIYISQLESYDKFTALFNKIKGSLPAPAQEHTNMVTYIVEVLLSKSPAVRVTFDSHVCEKSFNLFNDKIPLLKNLYFHQKQIHHSYDYNGKEMETVSKLDHLFLLEYLRESTKDINFISSRFDNLHLSFVWNLPEYEQILDGAFEIIMPKAPIWSNMEHALNIFFKRINRGNNEQKAREYIFKFIARNFISKEHILTIMNVVTYSFTNETLIFFKEYLLLNKDTEILKSLWLERNDVISGSRVPKIEAHIVFCNQIIEMIKSLPNPLNYVDHIKHWERELEWAKKDKQQELKRDFKGWGE